MEEVVASARVAIARAADYMSRYANCRRRNLAIDVGSFACLSMDNLSLHSGLTRKFTAKFVGPFKVME